MSKAKKVISMILAVAMMLTMAPISVFAAGSDWDSATYGTTGTYGSLTSTYEAFTTDTSATTDVIRVAYAAGSFVPGNVVVPATPSGIPENNGYFANVAYNGETPASAKVVFTITGRRPSVDPTIISNLGTSLTLTKVGWTTDDSTNKVYTYEWTVQTGSTATAGTDVVYTITYKFGDTSYTEYAYSHVENILNMNGYARYIYNHAQGFLGIGVKYYGRTSHIVQLQSKNMYSAMYTGGSSANDSIKAIVNFAASSPIQTVDNGKQLYGMGSEEGGSTDGNAYLSKIPNSAINGLSDVSMYRLIKSTEDANLHNDGEGGRSNVCHGVDQHRGQSTIYLDKRNETLTSLNLRASLQAAANYQWTSSHFNGVYFYSTHQEGSGNSAPAASTWNIPSEITATTNTGSITNIESTAENVGWLSQKITGTGPSHKAELLGLADGFALSGFTDTVLGYYTNIDAQYTHSIAIDTRSYWSGASDGNSTNYVAGWINLNFQVYDTTDLYNIYWGIIKGVGSVPLTTKAWRGFTMTFDKGAHPQKSMYTSSDEVWTEFDSALKEAGKLLANPQVTQLKIDQAAYRLFLAYNNLTGYVANVTYQVKHVIAGTSTEIAAPQTLTAANGSTFTANAATIDGYKIADGADNIITETVVAEPTADGSTPVYTIAFQYQPKNYNVYAVTDPALGTTDIYPTPYGSTFKMSELDAGEKEDFELEITDAAPYGWYYAYDADTNTFSQPVTSDFVMPEAPNGLSIYAKWIPSEIDVYVQPVLELEDGTLDSTSKAPIKLDATRPNEVGPKAYTPESDPTLDGYLFAGYYIDAELTTQKAWPHSFYLHDDALTVYGRFVDVNGKIIFEPNGGTAVNSMAFTAGTAPGEPTQATTKVGYDFEGWYYDSALTNRVDWNAVIPDHTGFIAYAKWTAKQIDQVRFDLANLRPSAVDTTSIAAIGPVTVGALVDQTTVNEDIPTPRRLGYTFEYWMVDGKAFDFTTDTIPVIDPQVDEDGTTYITATAIWRPTDYSAVIELDSYEKLSGNLVSTEDTPTQPGDVITVQMTSTTNFYTGSSLFIFMYDQTLFDLVGSGADAFALNKDNDYIGGINAKYTAVTNSASLPWPSGLDSTKYAAVQIAIDPTVAIDNYNTEPMADGTWMIEFQLMVKDTATAGEYEDAVYMSNAWTRNEDNPTGTMFYAWTKTSTSVTKTYNNVVTPDLTDATVTIVIDEEVPADTTVTIRTGSDETGYGQFADGETEKVFTGRPETEIIDYASPERTGYTLNDWVNADSASTATWAEGYYVPTADNNSAYYATWKPNDHIITFYTEQDGVTVFDTVDAVYDGAIADPGEPTKVGYDFAGWVDGEGQAVTLADITCTGDASYYATWVPGIVNFTVNAHYIHPVTGNESTTSNGPTLEGTTGYKVVICETVPASPAANTVYVTLDQLPTVLSGNMVYSYENNPALPFEAGTIKADGSLNIIVEYEGKPVSLTFDANGGQFANGQTTEVQPLTWNATSAGPAGVPTKYGYDFANQWTTTGNTSTAANVLFTANSTRIAKDVTYKAVWNAKTTHVQFMVDGAQYGDLAEVAFGSAITAPTLADKPGYTFLGWSTDPNAATGSTSLGNQDTEDDATTGIAKTYHAIYVLADVTLTLVNGVTGQTIQTIVKPYTEAVGTVADPTLEGYTFIDWTPALPATMPAEDTTYTANFDPNEYTITFVTNGASNTVENIVADYTSDITDKLPADADMTKDGYKFLGWSETEGGEIVDLPTEMPLKGGTFYANWEAKEVTYYVYIYNMDTTGAYPAEDAPSDTIEKTGTVDQPVDTYVPAEKPGFTVDNAESVVDGTVPATGSLILKVYYERNKYTYTFDSDGGSDVASIEAYYEAAVAAPADPTKTGYTFNSWTPALPATMQLDGGAFTAKWDINKYTVTFYSDDTKSTAVQTANVEYGSTIVTAPDQTKEGYEFKGYAYEGTTTVIDFTANPQTVPANNVVFVGIWEIQSYALIYMNNDGSTFAEYETVYNTPVSEWKVPDDVPVRTGYTFASWQETSYTAMPASQVRIRPTWTLEGYTIKLVNGITGETIQTIEQNYDTTISAVADPVMEGYVFENWSETIPNKMPDLGDNGAEKIITANFTKESYTITFETNGASNTVADVTAEYAEDITAKLPADAAMVKEGYVFAGWSEVNGGAVTTLPTAMPDLGANGATKTYYAAWTVENYTLKVVDNVTGAVIHEKAYDYGAKIDTITAPAVKGYSFVEWSEEIPPTMPDIGATNDVKVITAIYSIDQFTITFDTDGGSEVAPITQDYNTAVTAPAAPTKTGYTFDGWSPEVPQTMPAENVTIKATWKINKYKITFDTDGGTEIAPIEQNYGTAVIAPSNPTKTGYTFDGWDVQIPSTMPAENMTITAKWAVNKYKITFDSKGGSGVAPIEQDYNTAVTAPADPTKTGYTFDGWSPEVPATMPAENITLEAQWTINQYTVTLVNGVTGETIQVITLDYNATLPAVANPTQAGYTFTAWSEAIPLTMPAENKTITANFTINSYVIEFVDEYGALVSSSTLEFDKEIAPVVPATAPDKQYYTFEGWTLIEGGSNDINDVITEFGNVPALEVNEKITYYPVYVRVPVTLALVEGSTTVINKDLSNDEAITGYIYGLETKLTVAKLTSEYVAVVGDGEIVVTPIKYNRCGTGTKVEVVDNVTDEVVETYYIIIFGDINGDSNVSATDYTVLERELAPKTPEAQTNWSVETIDGEANAAYDYCKVLAACFLATDNAVTVAEGEEAPEAAVAADALTANDLAALKSVTLVTALIDQVTGLVYVPEEN